VTVDPRAPCVIGVAQRTWHLSGTDQAPEPLEMLAEVVSAAAGDAQATGGGGAVLAAVESLRAVYCMSWPYDDLPGRVVERLGISPRDERYSGIGGTVPQTLLSDAAEAMGRGELDVAVACGAEALDTKRRLKKADQKPAWSHRHPEQQPFPFEAPFHPAEVAHEVFHAWLTFAVRDVARRARFGIPPDEYRRRIGQVLAPLTEIAANNPYAWFPTARSVDELIEPTPDNRMVGYPYTKNTVAVMDVDMAAAVVLATHEAADRLGVPADQRVYLRGWAYGEDPVYLAEHADLAQSAAMTRVFDEALGRAGAVELEVRHFDLYSCFASSIHFACDALGLDPREPRRPLSVTGGLPYAGGPASNYLSHSIAAMAEALRADPGAIGMVTGVGMHMTKHVAGVYSTEPDEDPPPVVLPPTHAPETVAIVDTYEGPASIEAYSVVHGRDGEAQWGLVVVDLPDNAGRAYGRVDDPGLLAAMEAEEWVGRRVHLTPDDKNVNRATAP
jgi:acetyl-CoA C-acetyltransferase